MGEYNCTPSSRAQKVEAFTWIVFSSMVVGIVLRTWLLENLFRKGISLDDTFIFIASLSLIGYCATSGIEAVLRSLLCRKASQSRSPLTSKTRSSPDEADSFEFIKVLPVTYKAYSS